MTRWYPLAESDDTFLETARFRFSPAVVVPAGADRVWRVLTADDALVSWARGITGAEWTAARPFGAGTTRTVTLGHGAAALRERFYRWNEAARMTFSAEAASRPGLRRFAEDITLQPHQNGTRLIWTFAIEPVPWLAPVLHVTRPLIGQVTTGWANDLARRIRDDTTSEAKSC